MKTPALFLTGLGLILGCATTALAAQVTFQVNMSAQVALGNFDPAADAVFVAGDPINGWSTSAFELARSTGNPDLWEGTLALTGSADSAVSYKFVMNGGVWEGNVGPGGAQNRSLTLQSTAQTLPVVFFNNLAEVPTIIPLTFQVNLGVLIAQGAFDPGTGTVSVAGDLLNNWGATASMLTQNATDPTLWAGTFEVNSTTGSTMLYKFVLNDGATWEGNVGPDGTQNRTYTITGTGAQTLPLAHFNNVNNLGGVALGAVANGQITLSWTAGPGIRLQQAADLSSPPTWVDVPNTLGQSSATVAVGSGMALLRLVGP